MGRMKDLLITIYNGGDDDAVAAVQRIGKDCRLQLEAAAAEEDRLRLTDEEREAIETADAYMSAAGCHNTNVQKTLRGLLERLGESNVLRDR